MRRGIKLCLVYRDMWQSSGKYVPRADQLVRVAEPIIDMGCFARIETNGGGFEQINLLFGENPNQAVRAWTKAFNEAGIQTQMLERGLNALRMRPVPADVRRLMFIVKKRQGTDISRSFDGLNNPQNLENSFVFAREAGMIAQGALSLTHSPIHTIEHYVDLADKYIALGAEEICVKDMAGIGRPTTVGKIVKAIKDRHPNILVQYHGHSTPGFSVASSLEAARGGADIIDVGMDPLSWGTGHADLLTIHAMLEDDGFDLPPVDRKAYMEVRRLTQEFIDDFLGLYISDKNRLMNSLLIGPGLPGGMMGSLMADLESNLKSLNKWLKKRNLPPKSEEDLLVELFEEVEYVWPKLGYPPLVTPFSQYVKNTALMNVVQMTKGKDRWSMLDENTWGMLLGRSGQLPGPLGDEIVGLARAQNREYYKGNPQDLYPDELELFAAEMDKRNWDYGEDDEELMEYAMHPTQYEDYKSGKAKKTFLEDLEKRRAAQTAPPAPAQPAAPAPMVVPVQPPPRPKLLHVDVNGEKFRVAVSYDEKDLAAAVANGNGMPASQDKKKLAAIRAPLEGKFFLTKESGETPIKVGDVVKKGETVAYIEAMKVINAIASDQEGTVVEILARDGEDIEEDDIILTIQ